MPESLQTAAAVKASPAQRQSPPYTFQSARKFTTSVRLEEEDTSCRIYLLDLPAELFEQILHEYVVKTSLNDVFRCRIVGSRTTLLQY